MEKGLKEIDGGRDLRLVGGHGLHVVRRSDSDQVRITDAGGRVRLSITVTENGPVLRVEGASVTIEGTEELSMRARHLRLHGDEGLALTSGGAVSITTPGDLTTEARIQNVTATLGNVNVRANDDVRLNGERVLVNCDPNLDPRRP